MKRLELEFGKQVLVQPQVVQDRAKAPKLRHFWMERTILTLISSALRDLQLQLNGTGVVGLQS